MSLEEQDSTREFVEESKDDDINENLEKQHKSELPQAIDKDKVFERFISNQH